MKYYLIIIVIFACFISCKNKATTINTISQKADTKFKAVDLPNVKTSYDTLFGKNDTSRISDEVNNLIEILKKDKFAVAINKQLTTPLDISLYEENKIIILKDVYTLKLFARSTISDKRMQNTFPDFTVYEMNFKNEQDAQYVTELFYKNRHQPIIEELISVDKIFSKANKVYYFETRAEMFRDYINKYAETIKKNHTN